MCLQAREQKDLRVAQKDRPRAEVTGWLLVVVARTDLEGL